MNALAPTTNSGNRVTHDQWHAGASVVAIPARPGANDVPSGRADVAPGPSRTWNSTQTRLPASKPTVADATSTVHTVEGFDLPRELPEAPGAVLVRQATRTAPGRYG